MRNSSDPYYGPQFDSANASSLCLCLSFFVGEDCNEVTGIGLGYQVFWGLCSVASPILVAYGSIKGFRRFYRSKNYLRTLLLALFFSILAIIFTFVNSTLQLIAMTDTKSTSRYIGGGLSGLRIWYLLTERTYLATVMAACSVVSCLMISGTWLDIAQRTKRLAAGNANRATIERVSIASAFFMLLLFSIVYILNVPFLYLGLAAVTSGTVSLLFAYGGLRLFFEMRGKRSQNDDIIDRAAKRVAQTSLLCSFALLMCTITFPLQISPFWPSRGIPPVKVTATMVGATGFYVNVLLLNAVLINYIVKPTATKDGPGAGSKLASSIDPPTSINHSSLPQGHSVVSPAL